MTKFKALFFVFTLFISLQVNAKTKINQVDFNTIKNGSEATVTLKLSEALQGTPDLSVKDGMIQIVVPESVVWPKIEKRVSLNQDLDTTIMAYQYDKKNVRFRVMLPYSLKGKEDLVSLSLGDKSISLFFPKSKSTKVVATRAKEKKSVKKKTKSNFDKYDESYLDKIAKEKDQFSGTSQAIVKVAKKSPAKSDQVKLSLSALDKPTINTNKSSFSLWSYVGKFVAFLGVVLLFFYGAVHLMRKGVIKKGKLGFLNSTKMVEVLSTTYVGPKKNLIMVKAHNQVFLVGSDDKGLHMLSEIKDVNGLIKEGEKSVSGSNFDTNLLSANSEDKEFKLKEVQLSATAEEQGSSLADLIEEEPVQDQVKLSDQIKNKVKNLKQLQ